LCCVTWRSWTSWEMQREPGFIAFLDFSRAYDRLDRDWVLQCMQSLGLGVAAQRWVSLLQVGLQGRVRWNGWLSPSSASRAGLPPGSPLSPLLSVIAAQPPSARKWPGVPSWPLISRVGHKHLQATSTLMTPEFISRHQSALDGSVHLYCQASAPLGSAAKPHGFELGDPQAFAGLDTESGSPFTAGGRIHPTSDIWGSV